MKHNYERRCFCKDCKEYFKEEHTEIPLVELKDLKEALHSSQQFYSIATEVKMSSMIFDIMRDSEEFYFIEELYNNPPTIEGLPIVIDESLGIEIVVECKDRETLTEKEKLAVDMSLLSGIPSHMLGV